MSAWDASTVIVDSTSLTGGTAETASIEGYHTPAICVELEDLEGNADDTITVEIAGDAGTYTSTNEPSPRWTGTSSPSRKPTPSG